MVLVGQIYSRRKTNRSFQVAVSARGGSLVCLNVPRLSRIATTCRAIHTSPPLNTKQTDDVAYSRDKLKKVNSGLSDDTDISLVEKLIEKKALLLPVLLAMLSAGASYFYLSEVLQIL